MNNILNLLMCNLSKVGMGVALFLIAYVANIVLGIWQNVKIDGNTFDWHKLLNSGFKFAVLAVGIALLTIAVSILPIYATYIGIDIESDIIGFVDAIIIVGGFITATVRYIKDALNKLSIILGNS